VPLKNIAEPMRAYSLEVGAAPEARSPLPTDLGKPPTAKTRSRFAPLAAAIAALILLALWSGWFLLAGRNPKPAQLAHLPIVVLPFTNLSGDPSQDYFADGITENLTTELSRIKDSFVIARNTAFTYKGKNVDAKKIGKELGVRYVLEGSVQRDQNRLRVNAQLVDAESGAHLWAERFDRPLSNLFSMQDDIVASLASQLGVELMRSEARRAERTPTPDSMDLYFQGMAWFNKGRNPADIERARFL
jgi:TolB-like protein